MLRNSLVVILILCTGILCFRLGKGSRVETFPGKKHYYTAITRGLIEEAGKHLEEAAEAEPVVIIMYQPENPKVARSAFKEVEAVVSESPFKLESLVKVKAQDPVIDEGVVLQYSGEQFMETLQAHPDCRVFLSMIGEPHLSPAQAGKLAERDPVLIVMSEGGTSDWNLVQQMIGKGLIDAAIVYRLKPDNWDGSWDAEERQWYERRYDVVTKEGGS